MPHARSGTCSRVAAGTLHPPPPGSGSRETPPSRSTSEARPRFRPTQPMTHEPGARRHFQSRHPPKSQVSATKAAAATRIRSPAAGVSAWEPRLSNARADARTGSRPKQSPPEATGSVCTGRTVTLGGNHQRHRDPTRLRGSASASSGGYRLGLLCERSGGVGADEPSHEVTHPGRMTSGTVFGAVDVTAAGWPAEHSSEDMTPKGVHHAEPRTLRPASQGLSLAPVEREGTERVRSARRGLIASIVSSSECARPRV
jgi:hypothetical protein